MKPFDLARAEVRSIYKQDIEDVEATILLILALLEDVWIEQMVDAKEEVIRFLEGFVDDKPTTELDVFSSLDPADEAGREVLTQRLLDHILALIRRRADAALDLGAERVVEDAGMALLLSGAMAVAGSVDFAGTATDALLRPAATADLKVLLRGHSTIREAEIGELVSQYLKTPVLRGAPATTPGSPLTALSAQTAQSTRQLWNDRLEQAIGVKTAAWLPQTVDLWAYRWFTIGSYRSLRQRGETEIYAHATIDGRTTPFCRSIHGRRIDIATADNQIEQHVKAVLAGDAGAMTSNWTLFPAQEVSDSGTKLGVPPYHFGCRTIPRLRVVAIPR